MFDESVINCIQRPHMAAAVAAAVAHQFYLVESLKRFPGFSGGTIPDWVVFGMTGIAAERLMEYIRSRTLTMPTSSAGLMEYLCSFASAVVGERVYASATKRA